MSPNLGALINMNVGFFGIQYSFGLQQGNMSPIFATLGAGEASIPWLWLAGPVTGLVVQPIVGAMSDRTRTRLGRRTPYFLVGALIASLGLVLMPFSAALWMAASLLWILDAANNIAMEPYRAFVSDQVPRHRQSAAFLIQSAMTGFGQTLAYLTPTLLVMLGVGRAAIGDHGIPETTMYAFLIGAAFSIGTVGYTVLTTKERPLPADDDRRPAGVSWRAVIGDLVEAARSMPRPMRRLIPMCLLQWYAMFCYWQYVVLCLAETVFRGEPSRGTALNEAALLNGQLGGFYNAIACVGALLLIPVARRIDPARTHAICLAVGGLAMLAVPMIDAAPWLFLPMLGIGLLWASIMGNPYTLIAECIPADRAGVYMGLFNLFIVVPMLLQVATVPLFYDRWLGGWPGGPLLLGGALLLLGVPAALWAGRRDDGSR
jgi:maltose/moltooligosaccharide transporter